MSLSQPRNAFQESDDDHMGFEDRRQSIHSWQNKAEMDAIAAYFRRDDAGSYLSGLAIYVILTRLVSDNYNVQRFAVPMPLLVSLTQSSEPTIRRYLRCLVAAGVLRVVERTKPDGSRMPNVYQLVNVGSGAPLRPAMPPQASPAAPGAIEAQSPDPQRTDAPAAPTQAENAIPGTQEESEDEFFARMARNHRVSIDEVRQIAALCVYPPGQHRRQELDMRLSGALTTPRTGRRRRG